MSKLLGYVRLSKKTKASNSPARQRKAISVYAADHGHEIVDWAYDDESVSGGISPERRPGLGPWLRGEQGEFDGIIVDQPDRLGRSTLDFLKLQEEFYARKPHKLLTSVAPEFDFSTPEGRKAARDFMSSAEFEREKDSQRTTRSIADLRDYGWYWGGPVPYGLTTVKVETEDGEHWEFRPNGDTAQYVREMADHYLSGDSLRGIARWMNEREIPSPRGKQWGAETVRLVLRSPAIAGMMVGTDGEPHRNESGETVTICDPVISYGDWERVRQRMEANSHGSPQSESSYLYGVVYCGRDGSPWYSVPQTTRGKSYRYMKCSRKVKLNGTCAAGVIDASVIEDILSETIMRELGGIRMKEKVTERAIDHREELARLADDLEALERQYVAGNLSAERFASMATRFENRQKELQARRRPERSYWRELDSTFGEYWESLDWPERQAWLIRNSVRVTVIRAEDVSTSGPQPAEIVFRAGGFTGSRIVPAGRFWLGVWLGDLEALREGAAQVT